MWQSILARGVCALATDNLRADDDVQRCAEMRRLAPRPLTKAQIDEAAEAYVVDARRLRARQMQLVGLEMHRGYVYPTRPL